MLLWAVLLGAAAWLVVTLLFLSLVYAYGRSHTRRIRT